MSLVLRNWPASKTKKFENLLFCCYIIMLLYKNVYNMKQRFLNIGVGYVVDLWVVNCLSDDMWWYGFRLI